MTASIAVQAALILLREGLEAILVLAALAALLRQMAPDRIGALWAGAGLGLLASLLTAGAYTAWRGGVHDDFVEGVTCLVAAGLMLWTGGFLWRRADPRAWGAALTRQAEAALAAERVPVALGLIGFLAVFREGAETALFLAALGTEESMPGMVAGLALGAAGLGVLWWLLIRAAVRLPLRPLFRATSLFLLVMAARLVAAGIQEFQEQALIPFSPNPLPEIAGTIGFSPSWEGLAVQGLVLAGVALVLAWPRPAPVPRHAAAE
ncbi:FTR1 family protein [Dankookia sp. GCM10030260]|uniref:FTR1 family protein n=1 Tax=Dankookia sp. GCM10030260 TaxID=3273390 RepID=UPI00361007CF